LIAGLERYGYTCRHIAQEHSFVPDMWRRVANPDLLIFLDVSFQQAQRRRKMDWTEEGFAESLIRLRHAREHADLVVHTDGLSPDQILHEVLEYLEGAGAGV
jgi:hypothetical protein